MEFFLYLLWVLSGVAGAWYFDFKFEEYLNKKDPLVTEDYKPTIAFYVGSVFALIFGPFIWIVFGLEYYMAKD